jgi:periplasmic divalent cation tolerance protein
VGKAVTDSVVVLSTARPGEGNAIAVKLVEEKLAACVNTVRVRSFFSWEGKLSDEMEELLIIKTGAHLVDSLKARIKELHSYEVPEIIAIPIVGGDEDYLKWLGESIKHG